MKILSKLSILAAVGVLAVSGVGVAEAQNYAQADACQALTVVYANNTDPYMVPVIIRAAQDAGCLAVIPNDVPVPVAVPQPYPVVVPQPYPVVVPQVYPVVVPVHPWRYERGFRF